MPALEPELIFHLGFIGADGLRPTVKASLPFLSVNVTAAEDARQLAPMRGSANGSEAKAMLAWHDETEAKIRDGRSRPADEGRVSAAQINSFGAQLRAAGALNFRAWQINLTGRVIAAQGIKQYSRQTNAEQLCERDPVAVPFLNAAGRPGAANGR